MDFNAWFFSLSFSDLRSHSYKRDKLSLVVFREQCVMCMLIFTCGAILIISFHLKMIRFFLRKIHLIMKLMDPMSVTLTHIHALSHSLQRKQDQCSVSLSS